MSFVVRSFLFVVRWFMVACASLLFFVGSPVVCGSWFVVYPSLFVVCCLLRCCYWFVVCFLLFVDRCLLRVACCVVVCCVLVVVC